jgi:hypothetical protein
MTLLLAVIVILLLAGCDHTDNREGRRQCITKDGDRFIYIQSKHEPLAEELPQVVNRHGVRDTQGWWRDEDRILTCRDLPF